MKLIKILLTEELSPAEASIEMARMVIQNPEKKVKVPSGASNYDKALLLKLGKNLGYEGSEEEVLGKVFQGDLLKNKDKFQSITGVGENRDGQLEIMVTRSRPDDPRQGRGPLPGSNWTGD